MLCSCELRWQRLVACGSEAARGAHCCLHRHCSHAASMLQHSGLPTKQPTSRCPHHPSHPPTLPNHLCSAHRIGDLLERVEQGNQVVAVDHALIEEDITAARRNSDTTAWVNVIHGCNEKVGVVLFWSEGRVGAAV